MTIDEDITKLDDNLRRLKIEYDVFFGGGSKKPPSELEWRVTNSLKRIGEGGQKLSYAQRFRFNAIAQRYAVFSDLWRQKLKVKEEGYRRPADVMLGITGLRHEQEEQAAEALQESHHRHHGDKPFTVACSDVNSEPEKVQALFRAMMDARKAQGGKADSNFDSFKSFVQKKTEQLRKEYGCHSVQYTVEVNDGQVRLKAKAKV